MNYISNINHDIKNYNYKNLYMILSLVDQCDLENETSESIWRKNLIECSFNELVSHRLWSIDINLKKIN